MFHHHAPQLRFWVTLLWVVLMHLASCGLLLADGLPQPSGPVILTVTGNIQHTNAQDDSGEGKAEFDREMLEALGTTELEVETLWTMGRPVFEGVKAIDVMNTVGVSGTIVKAIALNDYQFEIPLSDFQDYPVVLALKMDGEYMRVRDKGPIWIIYPHE
ncbi:MAG: oxidoreductase [Gammaproteobacteria bacterium]|nr:oxidoreductase [Gammaproteobacteria bacterium]